MSFKCPVCKRTDYHAQGCPNKGGRGNEKLERNRKIAAEHRAGKTIVKLMQEYGLCSSVVCKILRRERSKRQSYGF